jgi:hypothetical protein
MKIVFMVGLNGLLNYLFLLYLAASVLGNDYIATDERMADHSGGKV